MAEIISGFAGALQGTLGGMLNRGQSILDRFFPPERRNELWAKLSKFATEKPLVAVCVIFFLLFSLFLHRQHVADECRRPANTLMKLHDSG